MSWGGYVLYDLFYYLSFPLDSPRYSGLHIQLKFSSGSLFLSALHLISPYVSPSCLFFFNYPSLNSNFKLTD